MPEILLRKRLDGMDATLVQKKEKWTFERYRLLFHMKSLKNDRDQIYIRPHLQRVYLSGNHM